MADSCKYCNESSSYVKRGEFLGEKIPFPGVNLQDKRDICNRRIRLFRKPFIFSNILILYNEPFYVILY